MRWWTVTIPTLRTEGEHQVRGSQIWWVEAAHSTEARAQALARAATGAARRHRRGAEIAAGECTVSPRLSTGPLDPFGW